MESGLIKPPNRAGANGHRALSFDLDMKLDCHTCISESLSGGRGSALDRSANTLAQI